MKDPTEFNTHMEKDNYRSLVQRAKAYLHTVPEGDLTRPIRTQIHTLKIDRDGSLTFQFMHDKSQDTCMNEENIKDMLESTPDGKGGNALAELHRFQEGCTDANGNHTLPMRTVTTFQRLRLNLGAMGCEINNFHTSAHMVIANFVDPEIMHMKAQAAGALEEYFCHLHTLWAGLLGQTFELSTTEIVAYVERTLGLQNAVIAPSAPHEDCKRFDGDPCTLMDGIFEMRNEDGEVYGPLINTGVYWKKRFQIARDEWEELIPELDLQVIRAADQNGGADEDTETNNVSALEHNFMDASADEVQPQDFLET
eukprot:gnl/TRDRNA2_/TRDRNA2_157521_c0_seq1.p1 gnl/TRDRNA2_/TRDRNA2_157521_c0~~gnl/TRDRNA2_/TRDRNA2_157521_c0_seq1.p1  ORF type:complete len:332 (+),score=44.68 gnl/TRDRNA2_/TRDRNA2_157521_c0_seq1:67-996(+)